MTVHLPDDPFADPTADLGTHLAAVASSSRGRPVRVTELCATCEAGAYARWLACTACGHVAADLERASALHLLRCGRCQEPALARATACNCCGEVCAAETTPASRGLARIIDVPA